MTIFDEATAVSRRADGRYDAEPDVRFALVVPGASTPPAVNGGALLATVLRAVLCESPHPHPVATSAHFLRVPRLAPAQVEVSWLKQGGTAATARAALIQDGKVILDTTVTTGRVPADTGPADTGASTAASTGPASTVPASTGPAGTDGGLDWTGRPLASRRSRTASTSANGRARSLRTARPAYAAPGRGADGPGHHRLAAGRAVRRARDARLLPAARRPCARRPVAGDGRRRPAAGGVRSRRDRLGPDGRADLAHAGSAPARDRWPCRPAAGMSAAAGSTRRPRSGTPLAGWSRRAGSWPGSAAGRCALPRTARPRPHCPPPLVPPGSNVWTLGAVAAPEVHVLSLPGPRGRS